MILLAAALFLLAALLAISGLLVYARWNYGILEKSGIPVIPPTFFKGSVPRLHAQVQTEQDILRFKELGPTWGLYEGRTPIIYTCDADLIREIFVKDVSHFYDRRVGHFGDPRIDEILDYLPGEKWKKMRKLQTVLFSSGKIRQYNKHLVNAAQDFTDHIRRQCESDGRVKISTRDAMDIIALDGIARLSFGIKLENFDDPNNTFYTALKTLLGHGLEYNWLYSLSMTFPILHKLAPSFHIDPILFSTFQEIIDSRIQQRRKMFDQDNNNGSPHDLADLLAESFDKLDSKEFQNLGITATTLLAQALNVTALDMISSTLTMMLHYLSENPEVQAKLHTELESIIGEKYAGRIDSEALTELPYLSACINETLRLSPPLIRPERVCTKNWSSPDGSLKVRKGTVVMVPLWAAHRNPEYFEDPEAFVPERFDQPQKHPYAYSPFGLGPRNCIGMRLAVETLKVNAAQILYNFRVEKRSDSRLQLKKGMLFLLGFEPLYLDLVAKGHRQSM